MKHAGGGRPITPALAAGFLGQPSHHNPYLCMALCCNPVSGRGVRSTLGPRRQGWSRYGCGSGHRSRKELSRRTRASRVSRGLPLGSHTMSARGAQSKGSELGGQVLGRADTSLPVPSLLIHLLHPRRGTCSTSQGRPSSITEFVSRCVTFCI